jgi:4-amino-4-deoxy-L-arabinose transferase-like glycosyltransferase
LAVALFIALGVVYLYGLTVTGVISADEPRYAAIGRDMAQSGDLVTPRLWGRPWFEKPPFLYWSTAAATRMGFGRESGPRLPVALLGFGFVLFFYFFVRREFGPAEALYATSVLGTSALWVAYSYVAVTDIPLSVFFCSAWLLTFEWVNGGEGSRLRAIIIGALLGLAVLAKGLVPLVLFAPVVWPMRREVTKQLWIAAACIVVAAPWHVLCYLRNGSPFIHDLFIVHHFSRFSSEALQHVRPFWFYLPVVLGAVFPWTPLFALLRPGLFRDARLKFAGGWVLFALLFFSASKNKLPGYIMPLLPALALILGLGLGWARRTRIPLFACALLLGITPLIASILPQALESGLSKASIRHVDLVWTAWFILASFGPLLLELRSRRTEALAAVALMASLAFIFVKATALPATDRVRPFYQRHAEWLSDVCLQDVGRDSRYALQYYAGHEIPDCAGEAPRPKIMEVGDRLVLLD